MENTEQQQLFYAATVHEFWRCTDALNTFCILMATLPSSDTKAARLRCYNAYVDFLCHLYEFYIPLFERSDKFKEQGFYKDYSPFIGKKKEEKMDIIFNEEAAKFFRNRKNRIIKGYPDSMGHRVEFYTCVVPEEFGRDFRFIRNRNNHVNFRRASNEFDISLKDFFHKYHKFVLIMHEESRWLNQVNENDFDWMAIDDFASEILK